MSAEKSAISLHGVLDPYLVSFFPACRSDDIFTKHRCVFGRLIGTAGRQNFPITMVDLPGRHFAAKGLAQPSGPTEPLPHA